MPAPYGFRTLALMLLLRACLSRTHIVMPRSVYLQERFAQNWQRLHRRLRRNVPELQCRVYNQLEANRVRRFVQQPLATPIRRQLVLTPCLMTATACPM